MKFKKLVICILVVAMAMSTVACGKEKQEKKFSGVGEPGCDFRYSDIGDSQSSVMSAEPTKEYTDFGPEQMVSVPQMAGVKLDYALKTNMHVLMYKDADVHGKKAELVYAFTYDQFAMAIIGYTDLEDPKKFYDEVVEYYDNKYGEPTTTNSESRLYMDGSLTIVVSYDGDKSVGVSLMDIGRLN